MFNRDYHEPTDKELREMVQQYEEAIHAQQEPFMEQSSFEHILEYYLENEELDKALKTVDHAITQYPFSGVFITKKAEVLIEFKKTKQALELLEQAELFDPNNMNVYLLRSDIYLWKQQHKKAVQSIKKAISVADKHELDDLYLELADIYEDWEKFDKVTACIKRALLHNPKNEEALHRLWFCYEMTEAFQDSVEFHLKLIDIEPYSYLAWYNLAHAYSGMDQYEKSHEAFDYVIAIKERYESAYLDCGDLLFKMEQYEKAIEYYEEAIAIAQARKETYFSIAECYEKLNKYSKARHFFKKATKIDPRYAEAFFRIGYNYNCENLKENAILSFERAIKLDDDNVDYLLALAEVYHLEGALDKATALYRRIIELDSSEKEHYLNLATILFDAEDKKAAIELLSKADQQFEDNADIHYLKAVFLYSMGLKQECISNLQAGLSKNFEGHFVLFKIHPNFVADPEIASIIELFKQ